MREIKFRAWIPKEKVMVHWEELIADQYEFDEFNVEGGLVFLQYTGLKDKNGKEIYEGDIIQWWNKVSKPQVVEATNGGWNPFIDNCTTDHPYHYIVIGNIYENPELLES